MLKPQNHKYFLKKLKKVLPKRVKTSHKANVGSVLVIGGFKNYKGAGILAARSSLVSGSGYSILMTSEKKEISKYPWMMFPDLIVKAPSLKYVETFLADPKHSLVLGPGLGTNLTAKNIFKKCFRLQHKIDFPMVVDADSFSLFLNLKFNKKFSTSTVFTPHEGELARLLKITAKTVSADRTGAIFLAQQKWGGTWVLKGYETLILSDKNFAVLKNGSLALSKAGTGDVLAGMIAAFLAQGLSGFQAALLGGYLHNEAAKEFLRQGDVLSLSPLNLIEKMPIVLKKFRQ